MDILVVLTGRRSHGKDAVADIAIKDFGATGKVAQADWFKQLLSRVFGIPLEKFHNTEKDALLVKPIVVTNNHLRLLMVDVGKYAFGYNNLNTARFSTSKWIGRQINSIRELMLWFGHDVISSNFGDTFHSAVTEQLFLSKLPRKEDHANLIFITDARQVAQSNYFVQKYPFAFPVLVERPDSSADSHPVETSVNTFAKEYFFHTIQNDGSLEDLKGGVKELLVKIKNEVNRRLGKPSEPEVKLKKKVTKKATEDQTSAEAITGGN